VQLPSRSGSWPGIRLRSANSGPSSRPWRPGQPWPLPPRSGGLEPCTSLAQTVLPTGVHLRRDGNIYDATRGARRMARRPIHRSAWKRNSANFRFTAFCELRSVLEDLLDRSERGVEEATPGGALGFKNDGESPWQRKGRALLLGPGQDKHTPTVCLLIAFLALSARPHRRY
jgi:hypothetical protein